MAKQEQPASRSESQEFVNPGVITAEETRSEESVQSEPTESFRHFFKPEDWIAAVITTLISSAVFFRFMAPEVTLQDSGELVTGAFTFGVPHPPGYPFWTLLTFIWTHFVVPFGNPAWRVGTLSVITGGLTVGVLTLMMTRSIRLLLHTVPWATSADERLNSWIAATLGASSAMLFGFNRGVWLWASVSEMRVLNVFSFICTSCLFFAWIVEPHRRKLLYFMLFFFALSLGNHQTIIVMAVPFALGAFAAGLNRFLEHRRQALPQEPWFGTLMTALSGFWELAIATAFSVMAGEFLFAWIESPSTPAMGNDKFWIGVGAALIGAAGLVAGYMTQWWRVKRALICTGMILGGLSIYLYMPIAAWTNPPMNWGYSGTKGGFLHAVTRGQYEQVKAFRIFSEDFLIKVKIFANALAHQYSFLITLLGFVVVGLVVWATVRNRKIHGLILWSSVLSFAAGFVLFSVTRLTTDPDGRGWMALLWAVTFAAGMVFLVMLWHAVTPRSRAWMVFVTGSFVITSLGLLTIINPKVELQEQEINIKFFAPAHGFYAMLIGYGLAILMSVVASRRKMLAALACLFFLVLPLFVIFVDLTKLSLNPFEMFGLKRAASGDLVRPAGYLPIWLAYGIVALGSAVAVVRFASVSLGRVLVGIACAGCMALPLATFYRNWALCNLRGHDFGYLFGYLMFYPGGGYEPMERDAVLYGGTDPGRFVPTYMIFCESRAPAKHRFHTQPPVPPTGTSTPKDFDRSDVYIITQNALADTTYMSYIRDHYDYTRPDARNPETLASFPFLRQWVFNRGWTMLGRNRTYPPEPIYIPSPEESNKAFQEYVEGVKSGRIPQSADIKIENGRVSVQGVGGVMEINGILARWIFDRNKDKHAFYVEESYVIAWMYPYLRPSGVIMKIEKDPIPPPQQDPRLWAEIVSKDTAYWNQLTASFTNRSEFVRNSDAQKSFSKMRSAIAGLYAARGLHREAEYAFRQAITLCPQSPEASFRLADLFVRLRQFDKAEQLMDDYHNIDVYNRGALDFLNRIRMMKQDDQRRQELEKTMGEGKLDVNLAIELANVYLRLGLEAQFQGLTRSLVENTNLPPGVCMSVAQLYGNARRWDMLEYALSAYLKRDERNFKVWIELASVCMVQNKQEPTFAALKRAVETGGEAARAILRSDQRFAPLRPIPAFQALVPAPRQITPFGIPLDGGAPAQNFPFK